jgi:myo-inositol-1(or 4)-monophosphatase
LPGDETIAADDEPIDRAQARDRLVAAVRDAGQRALSMFGGPLKSWMKAHSSPVSEADIASNEVLREALSMPGFDWLSEETEDVPAERVARRVWVVDPIDGTRGYIAGRPDWSVAVALVEDGRPIIGVVFAPVTDELFVATAGEGATLNGVPIAVTRGDRLDGVRIAAPKPLADKLARAHPDIVLVPKIHSLALRMARVAQGDVDIALASGNSHDWDLAAADLLVHEAGGVMTTFTGQSLTYNRPVPVHPALVAAGRGHHDALIDLVRARRVALA